MGGLSRDLTALSSSPAPSLRWPTFAGWGLGSSLGCGRSLGVSCLGEWPALLDRPMNSGLYWPMSDPMNLGQLQQTTQGRMAGFSPDLLPFPRLHFSASQADMWDQMTKFWPGDCGGCNKLPFPVLVQKTLLCEPPFSPSRSAHWMLLPGWPWICI